MANRTFYPSFSYGSGRVFLDFGFDTNSAANPLTSTLRGVGVDTVASLVRSGAGVIVVTLKDPFVQLIRGDAFLDDTANDGAFATLGNVTSEGTNTGLSFTVRTRAVAGTLTDYAARRVGISLVLRNGSWGTR
jgi:hypothetical protein